MRRGMILYVLGTDGAGKTTQARRLTEALQVDGRRVRYLYCQHRPFFLWLLKLPARLLFMRKTDQFRNYDDYKARKDAVANRQPWLTRIYAWLWLFDVWMQTWPRVLWAGTHSDVILLDRYYLDWIVNLGVLQGQGLESMLRDARRFERLLPRANLHVFLNVSEEVAFLRKNDIQSVRYLRERKERYLQLAPFYGFHLVDADQPADQVFATIRKLVDGVLPENLST